MTKRAGQWCRPLIWYSGCKRLRQVDPFEFEANLYYRASSRTPKAATQRNPVSKTNETKNPNTTSNPTTNKKTQYDILRYTL